jgi:chemotaxis signal transduction protein
MDTRGLGPILTFESTAGWYGLRATDILEIAHLDRVRPVPRAPGVVAGLAEIHGRVVTLIDLDRMLAGTSAPAAGGAFGVVLAPPRDHLGLLVRSEVNVASPSGHPSTDGEADSGGLLLSRVSVGDRLLNLLFLPALVSRVEEAIREAYRPGSGGAGGEA